MLSFRRHSYGFADARLVESLSQLFCIYLSCFLLSFFFQTELDGVEATKIIRQQLKCPTPIIALSASCLEEDQQKCTQAGMDDFLSKPVNVRALEASLKRFTGSPSVWSTKEDLLTS